jgi:hypothetical protein
MPDRSLYYDRKGRSINLHDWALMFEETGERIVATKVLRRRNDQVLISTVWVGIDRSFSANPHAKPLIFETVVYGGPLDGEVVYYSSEAEARAGHEAMIAVHRKIRIGWLLKCWMFFTHSIPTLRESMIHPRSAALARTALVLWTMIAVFGVVNFLQSLLVGKNYLWAPANFIVTICLVTMCGWALKGHRWVQAQSRARAKLQAEKEAFERMMNQE